MNYRLAIFLTAVFQGMAPSHAETAADFQIRYQTEAKQTNPGFTASSQRGKDFFRRVGNRDWSCATCHTENPAATGKHATTGKPIDPLAPAVNDQRFTKADKVEKWFKRNCNDVIGRACSPAEKSDLLAYLLEVRK